MGAEEKREFQGRIATSKGVMERKRQGCLAGDPTDIRKQDISKILCIGT